MYTVTGDTTVLGGITTLDGNSAVRLFGMVWYGMVWYGMVCTGWYTVRGLASRAGTDFLRAGTGSKTVLGKKED